MQEAFKQNLEKKQTSKGVGIYSKVEIPKDTIVFEFMGTVLSSENIPRPLTEENDRYLQIGKDKYLGPSGDLDDLVNHSCAPNCGVSITGSRAFLKTLFLIPAGTELTFDYSTTTNDKKEDWSLKCKCKTFNCRKIINGYQYLDKATKTKYESLGIVPKFLLEGK